MTVDANGSIHDQGNGRFAGHWQQEADTDTVLPSTAGLLTSIRTTPRPQTAVEPVDYEALAAHIRELAATAEPHPYTCHYCGANPTVGAIPCPSSPDHRHYQQPLPDAGEAAPANSVKVTAAYIANGIATVEFTPIPIHSSGRRVMLDSVYTWVVNGPGYMLGRGRIIKQDGTVGTRKLETNAAVAPAAARDAMYALFDDAGTH